MEKQIWSGKSNAAKGCRTVAMVFVLCFMTAWAAPADEILVKIRLEDGNDLWELAQGKFTPRFRGKSFLLAQGDEEQFVDVSLPYITLDRPQPGAAYYLAPAGRRLEDNLPQLKELDVKLFRCGDTVLLRIHQQNEHGLIGLELPLAVLPENIQLYPQKSEGMAPRLKSQAEMAADTEVIDKIIRAVNVDVIQDTIYELQENRDLDPPHTPHRSRYSLRVKETDDPSDDACDNAAEYIFNKFKSYGLDVEYDPFPHEVISQGTYQMRNIVATLPGKGTNSDRTFIICGHYDSIALRSTNWHLDWKTMEAPGANDNGSGTAGVLEAARILSQYDFDCTIKFIAFSGEELFMQGSIYYTGIAAEREENITGVLNLDMIAYDPNTPDIDVLANEASEWLIEAMLSTQREYNIGSLQVNKIINPEMIYSDHSSFWRHGWNSISAMENADLESPEFYPFWHTTEDTVDKLNFDMVLKTVQISIGTLATLADPMGGTPHPDLAVANENISLEPKKPAHGQSVHIMADVRNVGEANAEGVQIGIWAEEPFMEGQRLIVEKTVDVAIGGAVQISADLDLREWGNYRLLVKANSDYQVFETNGSNNIAEKNIRVGSTSLEPGNFALYPNPLWAGGENGVNIAYTLSKDASTRLDIYSMSGKLVYRMNFASGEQGGRFGSNNGAKWDGKNLSGERVSSGVYFCYLIASDEYDTVSISEKLVIIR